MVAATSPHAAELITTSSSLAAAHGPARGGLAGALLLIAGTAQAALPPKGASFAFDDHQTAGKNWHVEIRIDSKDPKKIATLIGLQPAMQGDHRQDGRADLRCGRHRGQRRVEGLRVVGGQRHRQRAHHDRRHDAHAARRL